MADIQIYAERFYSRLERLIAHWTAHKSTLYGGADALCIPFGASSEENTYSKSAAMHLFLMGYEFSDTIIVITKNSFYFMSSAKKVGYMETAVAGKSTTITAHFLTKVKDDGQNRESFHNMLGVIRKAGGKKLGSLYKATYEGPFIPAWHDVIEVGSLEKVEVASAYGLFLSVKDDVELESCKRAAVLSNKVMKHGFVTEMEGVIDNDTKIKHEDLASKIEQIIYDPNKIGLKVAADSVESCFTPIIQSGGKYDIKVSAQSNRDNLTSDVIICSLGARYKGYCSNIARTFMVDAPPKVEKTYNTLLALFNHCLEKMLPGNELKDVMEGAKKYLESRDPSLLPYLPKVLGFSCGLEFRDSTLVLNGTNNVKFTEGMIFTLSVGLHNVPLTADDKSKAAAPMQKLDVFSLLLADTVRVQKDGAPDILTKSSKEFGDVSYMISEKGNDEDEDDDDDEEEDEDEKNKMDTEEGGVRRSRRAKEEKAQADQAAIQRQMRQQELMARRLEEARKKLESGQTSSSTEEAKVTEAVELAAYRQPSEYPANVMPNQVSVDLQKECLILPINGQPVPFHVSTIKNVTMPEADRTINWMRINFYVPGSALGKEVNKNMQQLILKHGEKYTFIKEITYRSLNSKNLQLCYQQYSELRKRVRQREQKAEQEKDLVVQTKLIRIKDQRVPKLQDINMRPQISGRKCSGVLEAHQNGLRFASTKGEVLDIMYNNIKHCIYQPCDRTTIVLVHFHLKDPIMIGKRKQKDVQFYTEVIDASENLDQSRRSSYDPDELDSEQRERELRRRLNAAFKEFCQKVEKVAAHYDSHLQIDVPFRKSSFEGTCFKEMVLLQPTTHCLVNLTETPPFLVTLSDIEHVHFERVTYATKNFDMTIIFKNHDLPVKQVTAIDMKYLDVIQDWLNLVEITFTLGATPMNWTVFMKSVKDSIDDGVFYLDEDFDGVKKPAGWLCLQAGGDDEDEDGEGDEDDDDSEFSVESDESSEEEDSSDDDDSSYASEDSDEDDDDEEEESDEEPGKDWDELERDARAADKARRNYDSDEERAPKKKARR